MDKFHKIFLTLFVLSQRCVALIKKLQCAPFDLITHLEVWAVPTDSAHYLGSESDLSQTASTCKVI